MTAVFPFTIYYIVQKISPRLQFYPIEDAIIPLYSPILFPHSLLEHAHTHIQIIGTFVSESSPFEVNLPGKLREEILKAYGKGNVDKSLFGNTKKEILALMERDNYARFKKTPEFNAVVDDLRSVNDVVFETSADGQETPTRGLTPRSVSGQSKAGAIYSAISSQLFAKGRGELNMPMEGSSHDLVPDSPRPLEDAQKDAVEEAVVVLPGLGPEKSPTIDQYANNKVAAAYTAEREGNS